MTDREKLTYLLVNAFFKSDTNRCGCPNAAQVADHLIASGVVVREKGEWRNNKDDYPECDKCGYMPQYDPMIDDIYLSDFCPNCGADMKRRENDG